MKNYAIITDSCSDLSKEVREKYSIDYVQMNITYDGKELPASLDWDLYTPSEFYGLMKAGTRIKTTQVPPASFDAAFKKHLSEGSDVIYIACSSALSGSVNTAKVIADELNEKNENKIYCIDTLNSCMGEGLMAIDAAKMRGDGKSVTEVVEYLEKNKQKYLQFGSVGDLTYLKRAGRVNASAAFFGNLFGVKPIIVSNRAGENFAFKKIKGRKNSLDEVIKLVKENIENPEEQTIALVHADCIDDANYMKDKIEKEIKPKEIYLNYIGPIIGASAGPDMIAIYCKGKEIQI